MIIFDQEMNEQLETPEIAFFTTPALAEFILVINIIVIIKILKNLLIFIVIPLRTVMISYWFLNIKFIFDFYIL